MGGDDKAVKVLKSAKELMNREKYSEATDCIKIALEICPSLENGFGMLVISETLHYGYILCFNSGGFNRDDEFDYYSVLHLHSSSTEAEVKTRFLDLVNEIAHIKYFPGYLHALLLINQSRSELCHHSLRPNFDKERKSIILFEWPISNKKASFKEDYLNWKPPIFRDDIPKLHRLLPGFIDMGLLSVPRFVKEQNDCSPVFRKLMNHVFDKMPQSPHYEMLPKVFEGKILEGMKLVLDLGFVNLVEEIQKVKSLEEFMEKSKGFSKDLEQLSGMGYNVDKLKERINELQRISERDEAIRAATEKVEDECYSLRKRIWECNDSIEKLNLYRQNLHKESAKVLSDFESTTQSSLLE